jgi:hypothetical protein
MAEIPLEFLASTMNEIREQYGVDPLIFLGLYVGMIPLYVASIYYTVRFYREGRGIWLPLTGLMVSQFACYAYLFYAGHDLPLWIYLILVAIIASGLTRTFYRVRRKARIERDRLLFDKNNQTKDNINRPHPLQKGRPEQ